MVTKPYLKVGQYYCGFCSSEKINGNKTIGDCFYHDIRFCSSEKINGNKTNYTDVLS